MNQNNRFTTSNVHTDVQTTTSTKPQTFVETKTVPATVTSTTTIPVKTTKTVTTTTTIPKTATTTTTTSLPQTAGNTSLNAKINPAPTRITEAEVPHVSVTPNQTYQTTIPTSNTTIHNTTTPIQTVPATTIPTSTIPTSTLGQQPTVVADKAVLYNQSSAKDLKKYEKEREKAAKEARKKEKEMMKLQRKEEKHIMKAEKERAKELGTGTANPNVIYANNVEVHPEEKKKFDLFGMFKKKDDTIPTTQDQAMYGSVPTNTATGNTMYGSVPTNTTTIPAQNVTVQGQNVETIPNTNLKMGGSTTTTTTTSIKPNFIADN